jgi:hypothetical protein
MAEATDEHQSKCSNKPNRVDYWNAGVLTVTMIAVIVYACLTSDLLTASTRPYIGVAVYYPVDYFPFSPAPNTKLTAPFTYINFGKLPADAHIRQLIALSKDRLDSGPSLDQGQQVHEFLWPPPVQNLETITTAKELTDGEVSDLNNGHNAWLYVRIEIFYGSHRTDFCKEYRVIAGKPQTAPGGEMKPGLSDAALCRDPDSNYAS